MRLEVEKIPDEGLSLEFTESCERFPALIELVGEGVCEFPAPLSAAMRAQHVGGMIEVDGRVTTQVLLACSRCLKNYESGLEVSFSVSFVRELPELEDDDEDGAEVGAEEMGLNLYHGDFIELDDLVAEQVVLALPFHPLCEEGCKGLCQVCGANLNDGDCGCKQEPFLNKFSALKDFKIDK